MSLIYFVTFRSHPTRRVGGVYTTATVCTFSEPTGSDKRYCSGKIIFLCNVEAHQFLFLNMWQIIQKLLYLSFLKFCLDCQTDLERSLKERRDLTRPSLWCVTQACLINVVKSAVCPDQFRSPQVRCGMVRYKRYKRRSENNTIYSQIYHIYLFFKYVY